MFDIWIEKARQKMFSKLETELKEKEEQGQGSKVESFLIRTMPPILASIMIFLGLLYIFNRIYDQYGLDRIIIVFGIIIILTLRGISKTLGGVSQ